MPGQAGEDDIRSISTMGELIERARRTLSEGAWDYVSAGAGEELSVRRNRDALDDLLLVPRVLRDVEHVDASVRLAGVPLQLPVFLAPVGGLNHLHPDGALASSQAAHARGTVPMVSSLALPPLDQVAEGTSGPLVLQIYVRGDRDWLEVLLARGRAAGCVALCITVDTVVLGRRDRTIRSGYDVPEKQLDPVYAGGREGKSATRRWTWEELSWVRSRWEGPLILKGVLHPDDVRLAVDAGVDVIYLSNHGGRQLDGCVAPIDMLPEARASSGPGVEIVIDGGFMRGSQVVKALALGADAVGVGRLQCWGLAAGGQAGVEQALRLLELEIRSCMVLLGASTVAELSADHVRRA